MIQGQKGQIVNQLPEFGSDSSYIVKDIWLLPLKSGSFIPDNLLYYYEKCVVCGGPDGRKKNRVGLRWSVRAAAAKHPTISGNIAINSTSKMFNIYVRYKILFSRTENPTTPIISPSFCAAVCHNSSVSLSNKS